MIADKAAAKCHWHSFVDSIGNCAACGRAGCGTCVSQDADSYRCQECIRKGRQPGTTQSQAPPVAPHGQTCGPTTQQPLITASALPIQPASPTLVFGHFDPKYTKILVSIAIFLTGVAFSFTLKNHYNTPIALTLNQRIMFGYVPWALFWGAPTAWRLWRSLVFNKNLFLIGCTPTVLAWLVTAPLLLVFGGWFYCLFGGGIYKFLKHWWSLRRTI